MSATEQQTKLLDQLQSEINRVLEHTGRLFATSRSTNRSLAAAQADRLKQMLPGSVHRFHEALDQLDDELQLAKAVMRRDLALSREQSNGPVQIVTKLPAVLRTPVPASDPDAEQVPSKCEGPASSEATALADSKLDPSPHDGDTTMQDVQAVMLDTTESTATAAEFGVEDIKGSDDPPDSSKEPQKSGAGNTETLADIAPSKSRPSDLALQIDTKKPPASAAVGDPSAFNDDNPPDTAATYTTNADLESLFNDTTSTGGVDAGIENVPGFSITSQPASAPDFDFDAFTAHLDGSNPADNDSISALLPGLQDYANTSRLANKDGSTGPAEFDSLFASETPASAPGQRQGGLEHRDSTFDDLMDFSDFNAEDFEGEGAGRDGVEQLDFDL